MLITLYRISTSRWHQMWLQIFRVWNRLSHCFHLWSFEGRSEVLWAALCIGIYIQAALMFLAVTSMVGLGNQRANKTLQYLTGISNSWMPSSESHKYENDGVWLRLCREFSNTVWIRVLDECVHYFHFILLKKSISFPLLLLQISLPNVPAFSFWLCHLFLS
jgi:hypothetical protein